MHTIEIIGIFCPICGVYCIVSLLSYPALGNIQTEGEISLQ